MARRKTVPQALYGCKTPSFDIRFYFHAASDEDAQQKVRTWNRYHGFDDYASCRAIAVLAEGTPAPADIHDEYVR